MLQVIDDSVRKRRDGRTGPDALQHIPKGSIIGSGGNYALPLRQGKGNQRVYVACTHALKTMLDGMDREAAVILTTKTGRAWQKRYFAEQWEEASKAAGITDLHFHDLRGTAVTMLAEAGCTVPEIASITGHSLKSVHTILEKYMSRTKPLAKSAMAKFENASSTDFANRLQTKDHRKAVNDR